MLKAMHSAPDASECAEIEFKTINLIKLVRWRCGKLVKHGAATLMPQWWNRQTQQT